VKRGQVLAQFSSETTDAEVAQAKAQLAEADAAYAEAKGNADRARPLQSSGALSQQQIAQLLTGEKTAEARVQAARANMSAVQLRLRHTRVVASDDGIISARSATVGAVVPQGMELFRLIRQSRLEWRAEVTAAELKRIEAGQSVLVTSPDGSSAQGRVRKVAPTVDPQTRSGLVYVDLPRDAQGFKAGMFASGAFALGDSSALTLPDQTLILRDGFSYAFRIDTGNRVSQVKLRTGRRVGDKVEVLEGVKPEDRFVASGAAFLADGDTVRVTTATTPAAPAPAAPAAPAAAKAAK
jgi:RND family efflux transporter MFP subunit